MNMKYIIVTFILMLISFIMGYVISRTIHGMNPKIVEISKPLRIATDDSDQEYYLPKGTVLYYLDDQSSKGEGFTSYMVYVNVHGKPFKHMTSEKKWLRAPITAFRDSE